ncbi:TrkH family potassium uptake protein [Hutsoniella sourekii]|uniref:TrkH family potassium uptake protein n=1 Tax=Hutsoniella sourekii TaxID=87650 RepID=UPI00048130E6|nr:TrkH family potassium uptake protein [Hutsoniella sourekii]
MNKRIVFGTLGYIMWLEAILLLVPIFVGLYYQDSSSVIYSFVITIGVLLVIGFLLRMLMPQSPQYTLKEGFAVTALAWFLLAFFGGLPFVLAGEIPSVIDATFEMASGFTTTGASILTDVEALSQSMLFWRSFSHLIGGMGVLMFAFAILSELGQGSVNIMRAEVPGPEFGKLSAKNRTSAQILYGMYLVMTLVLILLLICSGMKPFDAIIHAFGAAGTGGFSNKAQSVGAFNNPLAEYILAVAMVIFGVNFNLYYLLLKKHFRKVWANEELRLFLVIVALSTGLIMMNLYPDYRSLEHLFRDAFFTVTTIISTTGYATADFGAWPLFSHIVLLIIMFTGAMAGSTAGGIKVSRVLIYLKTLKAEIRRSVNPRRIIPIRVDGQTLEPNYLLSVFIYLAVYLLIFVMAVLLVSVSQNDFMTAFSAVSATINNIGPGMGLVGPTGSFASFTPISKMVLTFVMIAGRLEIYPVLMLLMPSVWKESH